MSVSKYECYAEIYDFDNDSYYTKDLYSFTQVPEVRSLRHAFIPLKKANESTYYYLFGFIGGSSSSYYPYSFITINNIYFQKHIFYSVSNFGTQTTYESDFKTISQGFGNEVSCFQTVNELIICFYLTRVITYIDWYTSTTQFYYNYIKYDKNLGNEVLKTSNEITINENTFLKCIHLKGEVGIFASYSYNNNNYYPSFLFMEFNDGFQNYLTTSDSTIILQKSNMNYTLLLNDIIKINENKVIFTSVDQSREVLYIVAFSFFREKKVKIRYYPIEIFALIIIIFYHSDLVIVIINNVIMMMMHILVL